MDNFVLDLQYLLLDHITVYPIYNWIIYTMNV